jgi:hypothetical protein
VLIVFAGGRALLAISPRRLGRPPGGAGSPEFEVLVETLLVLGKLVLYHLNRAPSLVDLLRHELALELLDRASGLLTKRPKSPAMPRGLRGTED